MRISHDETEGDAIFGRFSSSSLTLFISLPGRVEAVEGVELVGQ
jgi:hypothetical protein